jgi:hypothetical protein
MLSQMLPPKPKWTPDDIPDLTGKVVIVTGACYSLPDVLFFNREPCTSAGGNAGCGKETVLVRPLILTQCSCTQKPWPDRD